MLSAKKSGQFSQLRQKAEAVLQRQPVDMDNLSPEDTQHLIRELQLQQIELELKNKELYLTQQELKLLVSELEQANQQLRQEILNHKKTTQALAESEERYRLLVENIDDLVCEVDIETRYLYVNPLYEKMLGYSLSELLGKKVIDFIYPEDPQPHFQELMESSSAIRGEWRLRHRNGDWYWFEYVCQTYEKSPGDIRLVIISRDITQRKQAEEEREKLLKAEHIQRELAETLIEVTNALNSSLDHKQVLQSILKQLAKVVDYDTASMILWAKDSYKIVARRGRYPAKQKSNGLPITKLPRIQEVLYRKQPIVISDTTTDPRWIDHPVTRYIRSWLGIPIINQERVIGMLNLNHTQTDFYTQHDAEVALAFANQAAIAIENAHLYEKARQNAITKTQLLAEVNHRVKNNLMAINGLILTEKRYALNEGQDQVAAAMIRLDQQIQGLSEVHTILSESEWSPVLLSKLVKQIIHGALSAISPNRFVQVTIADSSITVSPRQASNLALIINELVTNSIKHALPAVGKADTTHLRVDFILNENLIRLIYRDNGPGYPKSLLSLNKREVISTQILKGMLSNVGLHLIQRLAIKTLRGRLKILNDEGAMTIIEFKNEN